MKIDRKQKLSNRKLWAAVAGIVTGLATVFGLEPALKMTGQKLGGYGAGCTESVNYYKAIGRFYKYEPHPGDQIFFTQNNGQSFYHTDLVEKVKDSKVFTIEGNTSSAAGVVENGGAARDKSYSLGYKNRRLRQAELLRFLPQHGQVRP